MPATAPIDLHLDVGVVRAGDGVDAALVEGLSPLVEQISDEVGRVVDLTATGGGDGRSPVDRARLLAGRPGHRVRHGVGATVEEAEAAARRDLQRQVAALENP